MTTGWKYMAAICLTGILTAPSPAEAASRPDTRTMTCAQARQFVAQRGSVVMTTGRHTYEKFVGGHGRCESSLYPHPATAPTRDRRSCDIGYVCTASRPFPFDD